MTREEFDEFVRRDAHVAGPLGRAADKLGPSQFGLGTAAAVVALFPVVQYVVTTIGLPWLYELRRYSELQRQKVHAWIDEQHRELELDPDAAEAAGDVLLEELEQTTDELSRKSWEKLTALMKGQSDEPA